MTPSETQPPTPTPPTTTPTVDTQVTPTTGGPTVGLFDAAELCGVSVSTLRRKRDLLLERGARQDERGRWHIPVALLVDMGLLDRVTPSETQPPTPTPPTTTPTVDTQVTPTAIPDSLDLQRQLAEVQRQLLESQHQLEIAEARLEERAEVVEGLTLALRAIEAKQPTEPVVDLTAMPPDPTAEPFQERRRWWRKRRLRTR